MSAEWRIVSFFVLPAIVAGAVGFAFKKIRQLFGPRPRLAALCKSRVRLVLLSYGVVFLIGANVIIFSSPVWVPLSESATVFETFVCYIKIVMLCVVGCELIVALPLGLYGVYVLIFEGYFLLPILWPFMAISELIQKRRRRAEMDFERLLSRFKHGTPAPIRCSRCLATLEYLGGSRDAFSPFSSVSWSDATMKDLEQWRGVVCLKCRRIFCYDCSNKQPPFPCPECGEPTQPAQRAYVEKVIRL